MVKYMQHSDGNHWLFLAHGHLADIESIRASLPKVPVALRHEMPDELTRDEAAAWAMSALCRQTWYFWREWCGGLETVESAPIETWVLQRPEGEHSPFAEWFKGMEGQEDYRVLLHCNPMAYNGRKLEPCWDAVYDSKVRGVVRKRETLPPRETRRGTVLPFLDGVLEARTEGPEDIGRILSNLGHPYALSSGQPGIPRRSSL